MLGEAQDLALPQGQYDFVAALAATGTPIVVVMVGGRPRLFKTLVDDGSAILGGEQSGVQWPGAKQSKADL